MKKKLMIFAHYYYPDVASTGQLLQEQAEGMQKEFDITVICTVPSYTGKIEEKYKKQRYYRENINGINVIRVRVPEFTKSNKITRVNHIVSYFFGALVAAKRSGEQDYVFAISQPPILGGVLGVLGKWMKHAKMIYCIQDFNPEQIIAVGYITNKVLLKALLAIDKFSCKKSNLIVTVGRDLVQTLKQRFKEKKVPRYVMINNWIDEKKIYPLPSEDKALNAFRRKYGLIGKFVIMYSGNLGLYYDLENLLKVLKYFKPGITAANGSEVAFVFVGAGAVLDKMILYVNQQHMDNVVFIPYQDKKELIYSLNAADVHWCVNARGIKGVSCPSKFYSQIACNRPVLGVLEKGSEVRMLIEEIGCGLVCEPGDYEKVRDNIQWYLDNAGNGMIQEKGQCGRKYLVEHLSKDSSIKKYVDAIKALSEPGE